jgi:hypothetical protein
MDNLFFLFIGNKKKKIPLEDNGFRMPRASSKAKGDKDEDCCSDVAEDGPKEDLVKESCALESDLAGNSSPAVTIPKEKNPKVDADSNRRNLLKFSRTWTGEKVNDVVVSI